MKNRNTILVAALLALACFAFSPQTRAACDSPDPGCPGGNLAEGYLALGSLTSGTYNTGIGAYSLLSLTDGVFCTGVGAGALFSNTGGQNTAVGAGALLSNTTSVQNVAVGSFALLQNTGGANTAVGASALDQNIAGNFNTAIGKDAGALATGSGNVYIGHLVAGVAGEDNHTYIRNIQSTVQPIVGTVDFVSIDTATGLLGHPVSSRRYKEDIEPMDKASEALFALKPVSYRYKKDVDKTQSLDYGLIAEDVAKVDPNLAIRDGKGQVENVRYNAINAMLLNEFLKEHKKVQNLEATVAQQQKGMEVLTAQLKEQAAQIQKVSAQLEVNKPAPQTVANK
jgi:hypothetical protein